MIAHPSDCGSSARYPKPRQMRDLAFADLDLGEAKPVLTPSTGRLHPFFSCCRHVAMSPLRCNVDDDALRRNG